MAPLVRVQLLNTYACVQPSGFYKCGLPEERSVLKNDLFKNK